jgi:hypothetical protein
VRELADALRSDEAFAGIDAFTVQPADSRRAVGRELRVGDRDGLDFVGAQKRNDLALTIGSVPSERCAQSAIRPQA